jgi:hypothetical protein
MHCWLLVNEDPFQAAYVFSQGVDAAEVGKAHKPHSISTAQQHESKVTTHTKRH